MRHGARLHHGCSEAAYRLGPLAGDRERPESLQAMQTENVSGTQMATRAAWSVDAVGSPVGGVSRGQLPPLWPE